MEYIDENIAITNILKLEKINNELKDKSCGEPLHQNNNKKLSNKKQIITKQEETIKESKPIKKSIGKKMQLNKKIK
jgi:hypothetical protein